MIGVDVLLVCADTFLEGLQRMFVKTPGEAFERASHLRLVGASTNTSVELSPGVIPLLSTGVNGLLAQMTSIKSPLSGPCLQ
jgi:hypothetical protein